MGSAHRSRLPSRLDSTRIWSVGSVAAIAILLIWAHAAHRMAATELRETDEAIAAAAAEVYPSVHEVLIEEFWAEAVVNPTFPSFVEDNGEEVVAAINRQPPTGRVGSGRSLSSSGLLDGPGSIHRVIALGTADPRADFSARPIRGHIEKVSIAVECSVPWRLFPGKQRVKIRDLGAEHNELYLREFLPALDRRGIAFTTD